MNTNVKYIFIKLFSIDSFDDGFLKFNFFYFNQFNINNLYNFNELDFLIDDIIDFKLTSGFFKKRFNVNQIFLDKVGKLRYNDSIFFKDDLRFLTENFNMLNNFSLSDNEYSNFFSNNNTELDNYNFSLNSFERKNHFKKNFIYSTITDIKDTEFKRFFVSSNNLQAQFFENFEFFDYTNIDNFFDEPKSFDRKMFKKVFFSDNRKILSYFLKKKIKKNYKFNKLIKNFIKKPFTNFVMFFEFSLKNILLRSNFFFNERDMMFFLRNSYIRVNNRIIKDEFFSLKINDIIQLNFDKFYFFYYRGVIDNINKNLGKLNKYYYLVDQKKYDYDKQHKFTAPKWISNLIYFRDDIPNFLELDFLTMTLIILYKPFFFEFNINNIRFLNFYQKRLYNWKFII